MSSVKFHGSTAFYQPCPYSDRVAVVGRRTGNRALVNSLCVYPCTSPTGPGSPSGEVEECDHQRTPEDQLRRQPCGQQPAEPG